MNLRYAASSVFSRIPIKRAVIMGLVLGWLLLSTVVPVPAPPPGGGGGGPD